MLTFILSMLLAADPATITGKVVSVVDGDTIHLLTTDQTGKKKERRIRLVEIDAPEQKQPFGQKSKQALSGKIFGKVVEVNITGQDRYARDLGTIFLDDLNINRWMVEDGWAWQYTQYSKSKPLKAAQDQAKQERRGLWADPNPVPPWEWRKRGKSNVRRVR